MGIPVFDGSVVSDPVMDQLKAIRKENADLKASIEGVQKNQYHLMEASAVIIKHWADEISKSLLANCDVEKKQ